MKWSASAFVRKRANVDCELFEAVALYCDCETVDVPFKYREGNVKTNFSLFELSEWLSEPRFQHFAIPAAVIHIASTLWALSGFTALVSDQVMGRSEIITSRMAVNQNFLSFHDYWQLENKRNAGKPEQRLRETFDWKINFLKSYFSFNFVVQLGVWAKQQQIWSLIERRPLLKGFSKRLWRD